MAAIRHVNPPRRLKQTRPRAIVPAMLKFLFRLAILLALALPAWAARPFPEDAKLGKLQRHQYPALEISGKIYHMPPGGRVFSETNLIIMPATMPPTGAVAFQLDTQGQISKLWFITSEEQAALKRR